MESLERLFESFASREGIIEENDISEIIKKNLIPYFKRKGFSAYDATSKSYTLMAFLINSHRNAFIKKDYKAIINKIKEIRTNAVNEDDVFIEPLSIRAWRRRTAGDNLKAANSDFLSAPKTKWAREKEMSDSDILLYMSQTLGEIDNNLIAAEKSIKGIEEKLEKMEINGSHPGNP